MPEQPSEELKQARSTSRTTGSKDSRAFKHNKNRSLEAPPMPDIATEDRITETAIRLGSRGHGSHHPEVIKRVLELAGQGYTLKQISQVDANLPGWSTLKAWKRNDPEFADLYEQEFLELVDEKARQMLPLCESMPKVKGLTGMSKVLAIDKQIQRTLQIASAKLRNWNKDAESGADTVIIDVNLSTIKSLDLPGTLNGQNATALDAARRDAIDVPQDVPHDA